MSSERLLGFQGVVFRTADRIEVGPISLELHRNSRILLRYGSESIYLAFLKLLTGKIQPLAGRLIEAETVHVQTDRNLRESLLPNRTVRELLEAAHLPETVWLGQRRRTLFGVIDKLGLSPRNFHRPLKMEPPEVAEKFWALRFVSSGADVIAGREIFLLEDPAIRRIMALRWDDFPAAVIYAGPPEALPGAADHELTLDLKGAVQLRPLNPAPVSIGASRERSAVPTTPERPPPAKGD